MTPEAVEAQVRRAARALPRLRRAASASPRQPARRPGVGPKTAAKWINQYGDLDGVVAQVDQIKGKAGEALREHLDGVLRNRRLNQLVRDVPLAGRASTTSARQVWDRERGAPGLRHPASSGCCATGSSQTLEAVEPEAEAGLRRRRRACSAPARCRPGSTSTPAPGARVGVSVVGTWARGTGDVDRPSPSPPPTARAAYLDLTDARPAGDEAASRAWLADPARPKALHDAKGPLHALRRPRLAAGRASPATPRSPPTSSCPTSAPTTWPTSCCATCSRELRAERRVRRPGHARLRRRRPTTRPREARWCARRAVLDLADALDDELEATGGAALLAEVELPLVDVLAGMEQHRHRRRRRRT